MRRKRGGAVVAFLAGLVLGLVGFSKRTCPGTRASFQPDPLAVVHLPQTPSPRRLLLFVGIMTAAEYLPTRAIAVWKTWARQVPGRVAFFSSEGSVAPPGLPLVPLPGVDDSYPPQKKSLAMLAYMARHYVERFEWFMRADDDVLVRPDRLAALLRAVDGRRPVFLGQAGRGSAAEAGTLALADDENFCMVGPGVILSRETLSRVAPHLKTCLQNLLTNHEDVELGRCVRKYAGVSCTWSYEMQTILYHNGSGDAAYRGSLKTKEIHRAITLHPIKDFTNMYRLHRLLTMYLNQEIILRLMTTLDFGVSMDLASQLCINQTLKRLAATILQSKVGEKKMLDLFDKFISNQNEINVFRAPEPGMVHAWHEVACFDSIGGPDRALMCRAT